MVDWREVEGKYGVMYFTNKDDFLKAKESEIPVEIRRTYENYTDTKKPENIPKKGDRYQPEWSMDDSSAGWRYKATYDDRYGWGVMRTELKKKAEGTGGTGGEQSTLATSNIEAELQTLNTRMKDVQSLLEEIRDLNKVVASFFAEKGIQTADIIKKESQAKADAAAAAAAVDDDAGNEDF
jgi:hypothetical protein